VPQYTRKHSNYYDRKPILQFKMNGEFIKEWKNSHVIQRELGFDRNAILRCCKGKQKKSYWFIWKFKD
jgi:hypothetical protein